jgi:hypothetical protein
MKFFFHKILVNFIILQIVLSIAFYLFFYFSYLDTRVPVIKNNLFHKKIRTSDSISITLGSSHAFYGINTNFFNSNDFNFSSISQGLKEDYNILKQLKNPIKYVILPFSYSSGWSYLHKASISGERLRTIDYECLYGVSYPSCLTVKDGFNFLTAVTKSLFISDKGGFDAKGNLLGQCEKNEYEINDAQIAFNRHNREKNLRVTNPYLDSIVAFCKKNSIKLYIITMPFTQEYCKYISDAGFDIYLKNMIKRYYNANCIFFDFRTCFSFPQERYMFRDADHLSFCGRDSFSKLLNKRIILNENN